MIRQISPSSSFAAAFSAGGDCVRQANEPVQQLPALLADGPPSTSKEASMSEHLSEPGEIALSMHQHHDISFFLPARCTYMQQHIDKSLRRILVILRSAKLGGSRSATLANQTICLVGLVCCQTLALFENRIISQGVGSLHDEALQALLGSCLFWKSTNSLGTAPRFQPQSTAVSVYFLEIQGQHLT